MNSKILFVSSCTQKMYNFSGKKLIDSFIKYQKNNKLLMLTEGFDLNINNDNIISKRIDDYKFLNDWLCKFSYIIPKQLGGTKEIKYTIGTYYNFKASFWFRKVASKHYALKHYENAYDYIIWIDCDCIILNHMSNKFITSLFNDKGIIYFLGKQRAKIDGGVETGFVGFSKKNNGYKLLKEYFNYYMDGSFVKLKRWDDGYVIKYLLLKNKDAKDLVIKPNVSNPMDHYPINKYIKHNKGSHLQHKIHNITFEK
jgi:hypothetical protein